MRGRLKLLIKRLLFPHTYSSDAYIAYLRNQGVEIGENCMIWSPNHTVIDCQRARTLHIGSYVKITQGVIILTHDYSMSVARRIYHRHIGTMRETFIGDNVFIGMNAIILMGSKIGDNSIIGAGSVVSGSFPSNSVIAGNPAKVICSVEQYYFKQKSREIQSAVDYYHILKNAQKHRPSIEDMGNAFAWLYLPRTKDSLERYSGFFMLNGDKNEEVIRDFIDSRAEFDSYEAFCTYAEKAVNINDNK